MLSSMETQARPTRAEVGDVSWAVWDGADAVMTSGETSTGAHAAKAVATMSSVALEAQCSLEPTEQVNF